jgi:hypothetical protein
MSKDRPICVNYGCDNPVAYSGKDVDGRPRWRPHCSYCQKASYGKWPHKPGVLPYKLAECSNIDGHLGFPCVIDWKSIPEWAKGITEIDHKDGNHANNSLDNLEELCPMCHKLKGQLNGDYKGHRY